MQSSPARFLALLVIVSFALQSSASPLPEQSENVVLPNDAVPLEPEDDPARIRRYQSYGLTEAKVQRVQPISNVHSDATPFVRRLRLAQMNANPMRTVQGNTGADPSQLQLGGRGRTQQTEGALMGEEGSTLRGGAVAVAVPDRAFDQAGTMQVGQDVSDGNRVPGTGEYGMAMPNGMPQTSLEARGFPLSGELNPPSRVGSEGTEGLNSATSGSDIRNAPGAAPSSLGASAGSGLLTEAAPAAQAVPEVARQGSHSSYGYAGNMGLPSAQSKSLYGRKEAPSFPSVTRAAENGIPSAYQGTANLGPAPGSMAKGFYGDQNSPSRYNMGSRGQPAYVSNVVMV